MASHKDPEVRRAYYKAYAIKHRTRILEIRKKWYRNHVLTHRTDVMNRHYQQRFGISLDEFRRMMDKQDNKCAICEIEFSPKTFSRNNSTKACLDHCHITNVIRAVLCGNCNRMLGLAKDSPHILLNAARYLNEFLQKGKTSNVARIPSEESEISA
jgi:hypothetical protein